ncbi:hypothetical protein [Streptomyces mangrovisoli]|uniref:Uncharacterized protein n=1 Tax=Streptomyces mangrovisoli TaxID=1428628 RepID=A0A1J4P0C0_9ACTN|nr:hypothetical protein [Streptomyces mangrovisoli]OIJ68191.1 hypothetical protein WN71_009125 [Streptomyces mangrovisoli]
MRSLIAALRADDEAARFLSWPGDFELDRADHVEEVRLASGAELEAFGGDGAGGTFFFCGDGGEERPVLYADSEGGAALVAIGLAELLRLLLTVPWWRDCQDFTVSESRELAQEYLEDMPDLPQRRERAAAALGLVLPGEAEVLARLQQVARGAGDDYVLLYAPENEPYTPLII